MWWDAWCCFPTPCFGSNPSAPFAWAIGSFPSPSSGCCGKKDSPQPSPDYTVMLTQLTLALVILGGFSWNIYDRQKSSGRLALALFDQFKRRPSRQEPTSPHKVYMSTQNFKDAPLAHFQVLRFSMPLLPNICGKY